MLTNQVVFGAGGQTVRTVDLPGVITEAEAQQQEQSAAQAALVVASKRRAMRAALEDVLRPLPPVAAPLSNAKLRDRQDIIEERQAALASALLALLPPD